jgi:hypothetical protein
MVQITLVAAHVRQGLGAPIRCDVSNMEFITSIKSGCSLYEEVIACSQSKVCIKDGMSCVLIETILDRFRFFPENLSQNGTGIRCDRAL